MRSMTGQGRGECTRDGVRVVVELRTVNRRQAEIVAQLPETLGALEPKVRDVVGAVVSRGRCEVRVQCELPGGSTPARINHAVALAYATELSRLSATLGRPEVPSLDVLIRCPGVLESGSGGTGGEEYWPILEEALRSGLAAMDGMRQRVGGAMASDLSQRIQTIREAVVRVRERAPAVMARYRELLVQRLRAAGLDGINVEDERVLKELVVFADRSDISEELARLESHFVQFEDCRKSKEAVGRTLDFLAQEMHREVNTVGSKANDAVISAEVVRLKTELERFREQVQNVE